MDFENGAAPYEIYMFCYDQINAIMKWSMQDISDTSLIIYESPVDDALPAAPKKTGYVHTL